MYVHMIAEPYASPNRQCIYWVHKWLNVKYIRMKRLLKNISYCMKEARIFNSRWAYLPLSKLWINKVEHIGFGVDALIKELKMSKGNISSSDIAFYILSENTWSGPNDEANRRCRVQRWSAENGNRKDQRRTLPPAAASELSDWLGDVVPRPNSLDKKS